MIRGTKLVHYRAISVTRENTELALVPMIGGHALLDGMHKVMVIHIATYVHSAHGQETKEVGTNVSTQSALIQESSTTHNHQECVSKSPGCRL